MKKENKKVLTILSFILIVVGLILIMVPVVLEINNKNDKEDNNYNEVLDEDFEDLENESQDQEEKTNYMLSLNEDNNTIEFYKYNEETEKYDVIKTYKNDGNYYLTCAQWACLHDFEKGLFILHNDNDTNLYVNLEKDIFEKYDYMEAVYSDEYEQETYIVVKNSKYGLIDLSGKILYDVKAQVINIDGTFKIDNKNGLLNILTGEIIKDATKNKVEKVYSLIEYDYFNDYYKIQDDGKWKIYDFDTKELVINKSFNDIYYIKDNYFFEVDGNNGYIINEKGERLNNIAIPIYYNINVYSDVYECFESSIYIYETDDTNILEIESFREPTCDYYDDDNEISLYKFDLKTHQIFKTQ